MYAFTDAFLTAVRGTQKQVFVLVELLSISRFFTNTSLPFGGPWLLGEGWLIGDNFLIGQQHQPYEEVLATFDNGGVSGITQSLDIRTGQQQIGNASVELINGVILSRGIITPVFDNSAVRIRIGIGQSIGYADFVSLFYGFLDSWQVTLSGFRLDIVAGAFRWHHTIDEPVQQFFLNAPEATRARAIPILVGYGIDVEAINVSAEVPATLGFNISATSTTIYLIEAGAPFLDTGTISIGAETGITYEFRQQVSIQGRPYLALIGLTRPGGATTHTAGELVTFTPADWDYIVCYGRARILAVKLDGVLVDTNDYSIVFSEVGAAQAVTLVRFATEQAGTITVDCDGANIELLEQIDNGGFETGSLTPWIDDEGTSTIQTTDDAYEGTRYLEVLGPSVDTNGQAYQDFSTYPGRQYVVSFAYRDNINPATEISNGLFANGFEFWTLLETPPSGTTIQTINDGITAGIEIYPAGSPQYISATFGQQVTLPSTAQQTLTASGFFEHSNGTTNITLSVYDGADTSSPVLLSLQLTPDRTTHSGTYTPTTTTVFVRLVMLAIAPIFQPPPRYVWFNGFFQLIESDPIRVGNPSRVTVTSVQTLGSTDAATSQSQYGIGTAANEAAYEGEILAPAPNAWDVVTVPFVPLTTITRISLYSQYDNAGDPKPSWFDAVQLIDTGRNPVDVIAYIINTFVPGLSIDEDNFAVARIARGGWNFGGYFPQPGDSRAFLDALAFQCACRRIEDGDGRCKLIPIDYDDVTPVWGFDVSNILEGSVVVTPESIDTIYTHYYIYYGAKRAGSTSADNFSAIAYATPDSTSSAYSGLSSLCASAFQRTRRVQRFEYFAGAIQDPATAELLLDHLVRINTVSRYHVTLSARDLDSLVLQLGDIIQVDHPLIPRGIPIHAEVIAHPFDFARLDPRFTLRFVSDAAFLETFESPGSFPDASDLELFTYNQATYSDEELLDLFETP